MRSRTEIPIWISAAGALTVCALVLAASDCRAQTSDVEIAMRTDSDGDGMTDWDEWQAGTNPGDPSNCFRIVSFRVTSNESVITWQSVGMSAYEVIAASDADGLASNENRVAVVTAQRGVGPWNETVSVFTNAMAESNQFIRIRLSAPQKFEQSTLGMATFE